MGSSISFYGLGFESYWMCVQILSRANMDLPRSPWEHSGKVGLAYEHWPQFGIPSEKRRGVETPAEFKQLFGYYDRVVLPNERDDVKRMADQIMQAPSVLVCMERQAHDCHRSRLARVLSAASGLSVVDL